MTMHGASSSRGRAVRIATVVEPRPNAWQPCAPRVAKARDAAPYRGAPRSHAPATSVSESIAPAARARMAPAPVIGHAAGEAATAATNAALVHGATCRAGTVGISAPAVIAEATMRRAGP